MNTYHQALNYIYSHTNFARKQTPKYDMTPADLTRVKELLALLGDPQTHFPAILVAGTKGKGSTTSMIEAMLRAAGYKTGLYTSPHLHSFRERIRIAGQVISEADVTRLANHIRPAADQIFGLVAWEIMTSMAFLAFAEADIDIAVLEVGLGGRLDATNVVEPLVAVITSISYDHTHLLGNSLSSIAREKAGIIKAGATVVSAQQYPEAMAIIEAVCKTQQASLTVVGDEQPWRVGRISLHSQTLYLGQNAYRIPLLGQHQAANAIAALLAVEKLTAAQRFRVPLAAQQTGLATVNWPGRLEILNDDPFVVVDSAMNGDSAVKLRTALNDYFPGRPLVLVFGASNDHDYRAMLQVLLPHSQRVIATQANHPRAMPPDTLAATVNAMGYTVESVATVEQALSLALAKADDRQLICVTGSLFVAADARLAWFNRQGRPLPPTDPI